ncbi:MAG: DUF2752 domain-containing protein [Planctomycetes bacterium]|nr:DUF2752 domain-containing protein [Planctomycetota bacterium]
MLTEKEKYGSNIFILAISILIIFAALSLDLHGTRVFCAGQELPQTCLVRSVLNIDCPGCGLTRSFLAISRLEMSKSITFHPCGWLIGLVILLQIPFRILCIAKPETKELECVKSIARIGRYFLIITVITGFFRLFL